MSDHHHSMQIRSNSKRKKTELENKKLEGRVEKLESLLIQKGIVSKEALLRIADIYENDLGPLNGAKVIARAWSDKRYKKRLLEDGTKAISEMGFGGLQGEHIVVVENTSVIHNVVVCTLCSCYPWPVLGLPPAWYKNAAYRSRVVIDPRSVLEEFGLKLHESVEVRVWDSSAEIRYLVCPERPRGTINLNEDQLISLITREAMIGVSKAKES
jgi:nitrile hydratase